MWTISILTKKLLVKKLIGVADTETVRMKMASCYKQINFQTTAQPFLFLPHFRISRNHNFYQCGLQDFRNTYKLMKEISSKYISKDN